ncbi:MAG: hypothetical protein KDD82_18620 [Planctomycetes bacterium]|nr:hypothetical protein [Planctomycetota bacterium]
MSETVVPRAPAPRRLRRRWLLLALAPVLLAGVVAVGSVGVAVAYESSKTPLPVSPADRALVLEVGDLEGELRGRRATPGSLEKFGYFDGTWEVTYRYEDDALFLVSTVSREGGERDARVALRAAWTGLRVGAELVEGEVELTPVEGFALGDEARLARVEVDRQPIGSVAAVRVGHCVVTVVLQGRCFADAAEAEAALARSLLAVAEVETLAE